MVDTPNVDSQTHQAWVAVLEDDSGEAERIQETLEEDGKVVEIFSDVAPFVEYISTESAVDVGSIDWSVNNTYVGSSVLKKIREYEPVIGKVVYSVHAGESKVQRDAKNNGADFILEKSLRNIHEYAAKVEEAAQIGLSRKIARGLVEYGVFNPDFSLMTPPVDPDLKNRLYKVSRKLVYDELLENRESKMLDLVKRRGWWKVFNPVQYSELPLLDKLSFLLECSSVGTEDLACILEIDEKAVIRLFNQDESKEFYQREIFREIDNLLSIMAYVLRLSGYEPELMPYYWEKQGEFAGSLSLPPWDSMGLSNYLRESKRVGIENSINWIRRY
jgi:CheY-like chemotaxis protein